jgi:hypothetical protein
MAQNNGTGDPYLSNQYEAQDVPYASTTAGAAPTGAQLDGGAHDTRPIPTKGAAADYYTGHPDDGPAYREVDRMEHIKEEPEPQGAAGLNKLQTSFGHHGEKR